MKVGCPTHGCHFKQEFEETLKADCPYWSTYGTKLSDESKRQVWDWLFTIPADALLIRDNVQMQLALHLTPANSQTMFKNIVPGWEKMTEKEQQAFEKEYIKDPSAMTTLIETAKKANPKRLK